MRVSLRLPIGPVPVFRVIMQGLTTDAIDPGAGITVVVGFIVFGEIGSKDVGPVLEKALNTDVFRLCSFCLGVSFPFPVLLVPVSGVVLNSLSTNTIDPCA